MAIPLTTNCWRANNAGAKHFNVRSPAFGPNATEEEAIDLFVGDIIDGRAKLGSERRGTSPLGGTRIITLGEKAPGIVAADTGV